MANLSGLSLGDNKTGVPETKTAANNIGKHEKYEAQVTYISPQPKIPFPVCSEINMVSRAFTPYPVTLLAQHTLYCWRYVNWRQLGIYSLGFVLRVDEKTVWLFDLAALNKYSKAFPTVYTADKDIDHQ